MYVCVFVMKGSWFDHCCDSGSGLCGETFIDHLHVRPSLQAWALGTTMWPPWGCRDGLPLHLHHGRGSQGILLYLKSLHIKWQKVQEHGIHTHTVHVTLVTFTWIFTPQSYLIGWDEFRMNKWLIGYVLVIAVSVIDCIISFALLCGTVS